MISQLQQDSYVYILIKLCIEDNKKKTASKHIELSISITQSKICITLKKSNDSINMEALIPLVSLNINYGPIISLNH